MAKERLEPIGVEAIAKGVSSFLKDMRAMEDAYNRNQAAAGKFAAGSDKTASAASGMSGSLGGLLSSLGGAEAGFGSLVKAGAGLAVGMGAVGLAFGAVSAAANAVVGAIKAVTSAIVGLVTEGMQLAGTFQEMEFAALAVGRSMGLERSQIDGAIKDINDLGIRYDVAAKTVAQFSRNQIDLAQAQDLVRIAQGSAILIGEDSSATMERLTWAVTTQNTMMLRRMGIMTDLQAAEERYAESIGVEKDALTNAQKVQSAVNEIIASGASLLDVYDAAMESPTKRLRSFTGRILPEFKAAIGAPFLDAWSTVIKAVSGFVESLHGAISEGGSLYPIMINLGAAASLLADGFSAALARVSEGITNMQADVTGNLSNLVSSMFDWGFNVIASFANGMANAIEAVVVPAINALSNLLTSWFAPGSPPKILPEIDTWGAKTIDEWVNGMAQADFGALKKIQSILKKVVGEDTFKAASAMAMKALSGDGGAIGALTKGLTEGIHDRLKDYADEVTRLVQLEIQLAQAEEQAARAAQHLDATQNKLAAQASEYNRLLREGAPEDVLKAKRAQIKATEEELALAQEQNAQSQDNIGALKDETALQEDRVDAILSLFEEQKKAAAGAKAGKVAGIKAPKVDVEEMTKDLAEQFQAGTWEITSGISEAIKAAKENLKEQLGGLWADLKSRFTEAVAPLTDAINNALLPAWENIKATFDTYVLPALQDAWTWLKDKLTQAVQTASDFWRTVLLPALTDAWTFITTSLIPALSDLATTLAQRLGEAATTASNYWRDTVIPALSDVWTWLKEKVGVATEALANLWETRLAPALQSVATFIGKSVVPLLLSFGNVISAVVGLAVRIFAGLWQNVLLPALRDVWSFLSEKLWPALQEGWAFITDTFNPALVLLSGTFLPKATDAFGGVWDAIQKVIGVLREGWTFISEKFNPVLALLTGTFLPKVEGGFTGIRDAIADVTDFFNNLATSINEIQLPAWLTPGSPTPFETGLVGIGNALSILIPAALTMFTAAALAAITQVQLMVIALNAALVNVYVVTLPELQATTANTAISMIASIISTFPTIQALTALLNEVVATLASIAASASEAADTMSSGFKRSADKIEDKLIPVLKRLVTWLEKVEAAADRAADATRGVSGAAGGAGAPGFQGGANFVVPGGFPNDSFPMRVSSGERVIVVPRAQAQQSGAGRVNNFSMTVNTGASPGGVIRQFEVMRALVG